VVLYIEGVGQLVEEAEKLAGEGQILFRGQGSDKPLLPKIARNNPQSDTTELERKMLHELKRRTARDPSVLGKDDWDALVVAQHYGMATRLLDWTTNPLIALWFAISNRKIESDSYVFILPVSDDLLLDRNKESDPFATKTTRLFKPSINNQRLSAQAGWFTAHRFNKSTGKFVDLHHNTRMKRKVLMRKVHGKDKPAFLKALDRVGINQESLFPGLEGTCLYIDWQFLNRNT
jgi:hypothetical protein